MLKPPLGSAPEVDKIVKFLRETFMSQGKKTGVVAVSGGIDSALSLTLLTRALGKDHVIPVFLPYADQDMTDALAIAAWNGFTARDGIHFNIETVIEPLQSLLKRAGDLPDQHHYRLGNFMARARMMVLFDLAKAKDALVCGTENKTEKYLAYYTRFGDEASDIEPIEHLLKTQVRELARFLKIPANLIDKAPTAGLWAGQTDETELGFSYESADQILAALENEDLIDDQGLLKVELAAAAEKLLNLPAYAGLPAQAGKPAAEFDQPTVQAVLMRLDQTKFKHLVPYRLPHD